MRAARVPECLCLASVPVSIVCLCGVCVLCVEYVTDGGTLPGSCTPPPPARCRWYGVVWNWLLASLESESQYEDLSESKPPETAARKKVVQLLTKAMSKQLPSITPADRLPAGSRVLLRLMGARE